MHRADVIAMLSMEVAHLNEPLRDTLVAAAIGNGESLEIARSISVLGASATHLSGHHQSLVDAAIGLGRGEAKSVAIAGLGAAVALLSRAQRQSLVDATIGLGSESDKARAMAGLGAGVVQLSERA